MGRLAVTAARKKRKYPSKRTFKFMGPVICVKRESVVRWVNHINEGKLNF